MTQRALSKLEHAGDFEALDSSSVPRGDQLDWQLVAECSHDAW